MPHHWKPFDPGNPDCQKVVTRLRDQYGDRLVYVGFDGDVCWALIRSGPADEEGFRDEDPVDSPCERRNLEDEYVRGGEAGAA
jgi:hypothetical protein